MAPFDPPVQTVQDPVYFHWSHPITTPEPNKAKAMAIKTIADSTTTAVKDTDEALNQSIKRGLEPEVNTLQQQYISALKSEANPNLSGTPQDDTHTKLTQELGERTSILGNARANNKLSKTEFDGKMDALAQDYRSRFPGYVDTIDRVFQQALGAHNTANQYINSLLGDINASRTATNAYKEKSVTWARDHLQYLGPEGATWIDMTEKGQMQPLELMQRVQPAVAAKMQMELERQTLELEKIKDEDKSRRAEQVVGPDLARKNGNAMDHVLIHTAGGGAVAIKDLVTKINNGQLTMTAQEAIRADAELQNYQLQIVAARRAELMEKPQPTPQNPNPKSYYELLGSERAEKLIKDSVEQSFTPWRQAISQNNIPVAQRVAALNKAAGEDAESVLYNNKDIGARIRIFKGALDAGGPQWAQFLYQSSVLGDNPIPSPNKEVYQSVAEQIINQGDLKRKGEPGASDNPTGQPLTLTQAVKMVQDPRVAKKARDPKEVINDVVNLTNILENPDMPDKAKIALARSAFSQGNIGFVSMFGSSGVTEMINGQVVRKLPSNFGVFYQLTSAEKTKEIKRLDSQSPGLWEDYKEWVGHSFGVELFATTINDLDKEITNYRGIGINYNTNNGHFEAFIKSGKEHFIPGEDRGYQLLKVQMNLRLLNMGLDNVANVAKAEGSDANHFMAKLINTVPHSEGLMKPMFDAVKAANPNLTKIKASKYTDEPVPGVFAGSLDDFIKNPYSAVQGARQFSNVHRELGAGLHPAENNAPQTISGRSRGNLSDTLLSAGNPIDIPEGVSPQEYTQQLKKEGRF